MTELQPQNPREEEDPKDISERYIFLAEKLSAKKECFPFPGIDEEAYVQLVEVDKKYPGLTTPTDKIIKKMEAEGIKVSLGKHKNSGNVFILPFLSDDIENNSLAPNQLEIDEVKDDLLKELILINRNKQ